uniref:Citrate synthase lysine methyltransferase n=1 Tax=Podarcis muralis TaxID=64176 RepID=A0A670JL46_PODMU
MCLVLNFCGVRERQGASHHGHFDWFFSYDDVSEFLLSFLQSLPAGRTQILDVGCGTSALSLGLFRDSPRQLHISCLDFSPPAIDSLRQLVRESPPPGHPLSELHCFLADATALTSTFEEGSFHLVLDKGTCDTLLRCPQGPGRAKTLVSECLRVLRPTGNLLQFSDEDPDARVPFLEQAGRVKVTWPSHSCPKAGEPAEGWIQELPSSYRPAPSSCMYMDLAAGKKPRMENPFQFEGHVLF